ncbi:hypothetical protein [Mesorhizobium erdmanii]|uniref:hypothetical protein n=1 Tax=Mesorhizobium erdmanii TaxID=1777866 RepID=UPI00047D89F6|nr:hypothetical protein [Mesorhizobium erdmanii]
MKIEVILDTGGSATAGVDRDAFVANIQAELDKLAAAAGTKAPKPKERPAPPGAQGDLSALQWIIDIATDPAMAKTYASALIYGINQIIAAATSKQSGEKRAQKGEASGEEKPIVKIKFLGKELALPVATSVIKKILESIEG